MANQQGKNIVIIPVRGGSKRLPGKNIRLLSGIPLLAHSILYARLFPAIVDEVYISTDDEMIKEVALDFGAKVIDRKPELAQDETPTLPVLEDVVNQLEEQGEQIANVILLQATNPLREKTLLAQAWEIYSNPELQLNSLFTVGRSYSKLGKIVDNKYVPFNYKIGQRSQDLDPLYYEDGVLYICSRENLKNHVLLDENAYPYINNYLSVDIDTLDEFYHTEFLFNRNNISYKAEHNQVEEEPKIF